MAHLEFSKEIAALLVIDPYNEFISAGGKIWDRKGSARELATSLLEKDKPVVAQVE